MFRPDRVLSLVCRAFRYALFQIGGVTLGGGEQARIFNGDGDLIADLTQELSVGLIKVNGAVIMHGEHADCLALRGQWHADPGPAV